MTTIMARPCKKICVLGVLLAIMSYINVAQAHGIGLTVESQTPEGYTASLDVDTPVPYQNEAIRLDFEIFSAERKPIEFTDIWVRIEQGENAVFAGPIARPQFGATGFSTTLPFSGEYTVFVRFNDDNTVITETQFTLFVEAAKSAGNGGGALAMSVATFVIGVLCGFFAAQLFMKRKVSNEVS